MAFHVTTNVDFQNYMIRLGRIERYFSTPAAELIIVPENLPYDLDFDSNACPRMHAHYVRMDDGLAASVGQEMKKNGIKILQVHSPSDFEMNGFNEGLFSFMMRFFGVMRNECDLEQLSFNYHGIGSPIECQEGENYGIKMRNAHKELDGIAGMIHQVNADCGYPFDLLLAENNGIGENSNPPATCNPAKLKITDLLPEDSYGRRGIHGVTFDFAHGFRVAECRRNNVDYPNLAWCGQDYELHSGGLPPSASDFSAYVKAMAPRTRWVHVAGERELVSHQRVHLDDRRNIIDFARYIREFRQHMGVDRDIGVTIETIDSPTPSGFEMMRRYHPWLHELFNGSGT